MEKKGQRTKVDQPPLLSSSSSSSGDEGKEVTAATCYQTTSSQQPLSPNKGDKLLGSPDRNPALQSQPSIFTSPSTHQTGAASTHHDSLAAAEVLQTAVPTPPPGSRRQPTNTHFQFTDMDRKKQEQQQQQLQQLNRAAHNLELLGVQPCDTRNNNNSWWSKAYNIRPSLLAKEVPVEMRESYIETGYRPPGLGVTVSAFSALYLHNETLNFWTHMIPFLYFAYFLFVDQGPWLRLSLISGLGRYPFYGYMFGICTLFGASSFAHLFHCAGQRRWRNVCFVIDYAAISVYGTASAIAYYFYSRPRFRGTFIGYMLSGEGHFLGFTTATAWVATYASCITRLRPTKFCYAIRTLAFTLPFVTGSFPAILRWMHLGAVLKGPPAVVVANATPVSAGANLGEAVANATASVVMDTGVYRFPQLDYDFSTPYTCHLVMLAGGALINVIKIPERFFPGRFDMIGSSHQWFHLLVFTSIREQFWLMLEEIACHSGMLYARDPDKSMPWGRATIKLSQSEDPTACTIITSTSSVPVHHYTSPHIPHTMARSSWFYPWGWSWNSLLFCALGNPRSSLDTWMALNTIAWMTILLSSLTITIVWFGYSYNFTFTDTGCSEEDHNTAKRSSLSPSKRSSSAPTSSNISPSSTLSSPDSLSFNDNIPNIANFFNRCQDNKNQDPGQSYLPSDIRQRTHLQVKQ